MHSSISGCDSVCASSSTSTTWPSPEAEARLGPADLERAAAAATGAQPGGHVAQTRRSSSSPGRRATRRRRTRPPPDTSAAAPSGRATGRSGRRGPPRPARPRSSTVTTLRGTPGRRLHTSLERPRRQHRVDGPRQVDRGARAGRPPGRRRRPRGRSAPRRRCARRARRPRPGADGADGVVVVLRALGVDRDDALADAGRAARVEDVGPVGERLGLLEDGRAGAGGRGPDRPGGPRWRLRRGGRARGSRAPPRRARASARSRGRRSGPGRGCGCAGRRPGRPRTPGAGRRPAPRPPPPRRRRAGAPPAAHPRRGRRATATALVSASSPRVAGLSLTWTGGTRPLWPMSCPDGVR